MSKSASYGLRAAALVTVLVMVISSFGGVTGIVVGLVLGRIIHLYAGWETAVSPGGIALAFGISVLIGVCFGVVPARRAAQLDPIQALRFE